MTILHCLIRWTAASLGLLVWIATVPAHAQSADAINDLLRGGAGAAPVSPSEQRVGPSAKPEGNTWSAPQVGKDTDGALRITYHGQAAADGRKARITLLFHGAKVSGTIWMQGVCETNVRLGGADLTFEAQLSGAWESKDARISGSWEGTEHFCGSDVKNHGTLDFFLKDDGYFDPVTHLRITGERGRYGWNFAPAGRVLIEDPEQDPPVAGVVFPTDAEDPIVPGAKPDADPDGAGGADDKDDKDDKPRIPWREPINPDQITGFELTPRTLYLKPGKSRRLPWVIALIGDDSGVSDRDVPANNLEWILSSGLEIVDGQLKLSAMVKDSKDFPFSVKVEIGDRKKELEGVVKAVVDDPLGSISGSVIFQFSPFLEGGAGLRPLRATVELVPAGKTQGERVRVVTGADGAYLFENLPRGVYYVEVRSVVPPDFPPGYVLKRTRNWGHPSPIWIGEETGLYVKTPPIWDHKRKTATVHVHKPPPTDGSIYGRVIYNDKGVEGVTVMAHNVTDSELHDEVISGDDGAYQLNIDDLPAGKYWIRAEKYRKARIAGPDDLLDIRTNRLGDAILVHSPLSDPRGVPMDIEVDTRRAIFGGPAEQPEIPALPGE